MPLSDRARSGLPPELADALAALLRPLAQLCVAQGLPFVEVQERLKSAYVEAAKAGVPDTARRVSRISTTTGINRREVTRLLGAQPRPASAKSRSRSVAAEVFAHWTTAREFRDRRGVARTLPRQGDGATFEALARSVTTDVHPRSILEELVRLGLATVDPKRDRVALVRDAFVPQGDALRMIGFVGENVGDHLAGAVANVLGDGKRHFEQAVFVDALSDASMREVRVMIAAQWKSLIQSMVPALERFIEDDRSQRRAVSQRLRIGLYSYDTSTPSVPDAAPKANRARKPPPAKEPTE